MSAKTRAYYDIASARFVDNVCQHVLMYLVPGCHNLVERIEIEIGLNNIPANRQKIAALMSEDQEREHERERLRIEEQKLQNGLEQIEQVLGKFRSSEVFDQMVQDYNDISPSMSMLGNFVSTSSSPTKRKVASQLSDQLSEMDGEWNQIDESPTKRAKATLDEELTTPTAGRLTRRMRNASLG